MKYWIMQSLVKSKDYFLQYIIQGVFRNIELIFLLKSQVRRFFVFWCSHI